MEYTILAQQMDAFVENNHIPGYALEILENRQATYIRTHGYVDIAQQRPVRMDSIFRLMSMSKPITAVAAMMLVEKGMLRLDDPLTRYLKEVPSPDLTILNLLNHTSGWGMGDETAVNRVYQQETTLAGRAREWSKLPLDFPPNTQTGYSAMVALDVMGYIIQQVSGQIFQDFLVQHIFRPLGMADTGFLLTPQQQTRVARLYCAENGTLTDVTDTEPSVARLDANRNGYFSGSGGMVGTLQDYVQFACMLSNQGTWNGVQILRPETVAAMGTSTMPEGVVLGPGMRWGIGMLVHDADSPLPLPVGTFGWSGAYGTHFWIDPAQDMAVVLMVNVSNIGGVGSHVSRALEQLVYTAV